MDNLDYLDTIWNGQTAEPMSKKLEPGTYRGTVLDYKIGQIGKNMTWALMVLLHVDYPIENQGSEVEKVWYLTPKTMPYVARDLMELDCRLDSSKKLSEQLQNLPINRISVDFRYDVPKDKEYAEVQWLRISKNSIKTPQGAGDGVKPKSTLIKHSVEKGNGYQPQDNDKIPF